jgi:hypothetical protein
VTVAWRATGVARPLPADPAVDAAAAAGTLEAWWAALPDQDIRRSYVPPAAPAWASSPQFPFDAGAASFDLEWRPLPWPDVWLQLWLRGAAAATALPGIVGRLREVQEQWNDADKDRAASGIIHEVGSQAAVLAGDVVVVDVDFGSADPAALAAMFRALDATVEVTRVIVGSALLAQAPAE